MTNSVYRYLEDTDKYAIVKAHIKNLEHTIYSLEVSKIEALAENTPDTAQITSMDSQILASNNKIESLLAEMSSLEV
jgi:hypothetical protein